MQRKESNKKEILEHAIEFFFNTWEVKINTAWECLKQKLVMGERGRLQGKQSHSRLGLKGRADLHSGLQKGYSTLTTQQAKAEKCARESQV